MKIKKILSILSVVLAIVALSCVVYGDEISDALHFADTVSSFDSQVVETPWTPTSVLNDPRSNIPTVTICTSSNSNAYCSVIREKYGFEDDFIMTSYDYAPESNDTYYDQISAKAYEINVSWTLENSGMPEAITTDLAKKLCFSYFYKNNPFFSTELLAEGKCSLVIKQTINGNSNGFNRSNVDCVLNWQDRMITATVDNSHSGENQLAIAKVYTDTYVQASTVDINLSDGAVIISGININSERGWNAIYAKYKGFIVGFTGIATLTCIIVGICFILKLGAASDNVQNRKMAIKALLMCGIGTIALGSLTLIFSIFFNML